MDCGAGHGVLESGVAPHRSIFAALMVQMSEHCVTKGQKSILGSEGWGVMCRQQGIVQGAWKRRSIDLALGYLVPFVFAFGSAFRLCSEFVVSGEED